MARTAAGVRLVLSDFWHYRVLKSARKAVWLPFARLKARAAETASEPQFTRTAYGVKMMERWHDRTFVYCRGGIYGRFLADELEQRKSPFVFVDIGANQGLYSLIAAQNPACEQVIAFEPVASTYAVLQQNAAANGLSERVSAHQLAISGDAGPREISVPRRHSGMASLSKGQASHAGQGESETIDAINHERLGALLAGDAPLVVKVDVEGLEAAVIAELLASSAAPRIEMIFYEVDTRWSDGPEIAAMLKKAGLGKLRKVGFGHHFDVVAKRA